MCHGQVIYQAPILSVFRCEVCGMTANGGMLLRYRMTGEARMDRVCRDCARKILDTQK